MVLVRRRNNILKCNVLNKCRLFISGYFYWGKGREIVLSLEIFFFDLESFSFFYVLFLSR